MSIGTSSSGGDNTVGTEPHPLDLHGLRCVHHLRWSSSPANSERDDAQANGTFNRTHEATVARRCAYPGGASSRSRLLMVRFIRRSQTDRGGLATRALKGGSVLAVGTVIERLARLARNIILARIIAPEHFGTMAIILAVVALFEALLEVGITQAVIQNPKGMTPSFLNVAWWLSTFRGVILYGIAAALSPVVALAYDNPEFVPLLCVAFLAIIFNGATSPKVYALQREFRFGPNVVVIQGAGLIGTVATILLAIQLESVWALVWGTVLEAFVRLVLSHVICPIRLHFRLDRDSLRELLRFTLGMAGIPLLTYVIMNADVVVLGRMVTPTQLGLYSLAITLAAFPLTIFSKVIQPLSVPLLVRFVDDTNELRDAFLRMTRLVWLFGLPMATCLAVFSTPLLVLVYGRPDFADVAPAFSIYSYFIVAYMAGMVSFSVYLAIARPGIQRRFTVVRAVLVLLALYPFVLLWGTTGAALALLASLMIAMVAQLFSLRRIIDLPIVSYLRSMRPGVVAAGAAVGPALGVRYLLDLPDWGQVALGAVIGGLIWAVLVVREGRELRRLRNLKSAG